MRTVTVLFELLVYQPYLLSRMRPRKQILRLDAIVAQVLGGPGASEKLKVQISSRAGPAFTNTTILLLCMDQVRYLAIELCAESVDVEIWRVGGRALGAAAAEKSALSSTAPSGATAISFTFRSLHLQEGYGANEQITFSSMIDRVLAGLRRNIDEFGRCAADPASRRLPRGTAVDLHLRTLELIAQRGGLGLRVRIGEGLSGERGKGSPGPPDTAGRTEHKDEQKAGQKAAPRAGREPGYNYQISLLV